MSEGRNESCEGMEKGKGEKDKQRHCQRNQGGRKKEGKRREEARKVK